MKTKKFRVLKIVAVICFLYAIIQIAIGVYILFSSESNENIIDYITTVKSDDDNEKEEINKKIENDDEIEISGEKYPKEDFLLVIKIILFIVYFIQALFFIIEGLLIIRAISTGKTKLIIVFLLLGFILPLLTLINAAINNTYNINSASNLVSLIIKTTILKKVFEIRRLNIEI